MNFADNLKRICTERGTSPTALLKSMGVATSKVAMWNSGSLPKQEMLIRLAKELDCSVMDFFADDDTIQTPLNIAEPKDEDESDVLRVYRSLSRRMKHEFMTMVYEFEKRQELEGEKQKINRLLFEIKEKAVIPYEVLKTLRRLTSRKQALEREL